MENYRDAPLLDTRAEPPATRASADAIQRHRVISPFFSFFPLLRRAQRLLRNTLEIDPPGAGPILSQQDAVPFLQAAAVRGPFFPEENLSPPPPSLFLFSRSR